MSIISKYMRKNSINIFLKENNDKSTNESTNLLKLAKMLSWDPLHLGLDSIYFSFESILSLYF